MKNYAMRETFYLLTKEEERKANNKWILCYYLNAFSTFTFFRSRWLVFRKKFNKLRVNFLLFFFLPLVRAFFLENFLFFTFPSFLLLFFLLLSCSRWKGRKFVEGRLLLLDDSILFWLFMIKYSWCLVFVLRFLSHKQKLLSLSLSLLFLFAKLNVNFIQSTEKHS